MYLGICIAWTIFWSLWSVLLTRLDEHTNRQTIKGILFWFSRCPHCKKRLHAQNLIPIVSYIKQEGKCAFCKKKISLRYPILEITSGLIFMLSYYLVYNTMSYMVLDEYKISTLVFRCITNRTLLLLIIYDLQQYELHMPTRILSIFWILWRQFLGMQGNYQRAVVWSLIFGIVFLWIYRWGKRYAKKKYHQEEWFGQGDVFIGFLLGSLFPWIAMYNLVHMTIQNVIKILLLFLIISSLLGLLYFAITYLRKTFKNKKLWAVSHDLWAKFKIIPFIPSLIITFWILLFYADRIVAFVFN